MRAFSAILSGADAGTALLVFIVVGSKNNNGEAPPLRPALALRVHEYFRNHSILNGLKSLQDEEGNWDSLPEAVENPGPPGTVTFWHNKMMHNAGNNCRPDIRMACVSRFSRKDLIDTQFEMYEDMWEDWAI